MPAVYASHMLEVILESVRRRLPDVVARQRALMAEAAAREPARDFIGALSGPGLDVIAEIKRRSPSAGTIASGLDPVAQAREYAAGGAAALSVLTENEFFGGSLEDLAAARDATELPVLRKDFVVHPAQIWESRAAGADAVLLITAALANDALAGLLSVASDAGIAALVEVHDEQEAAVALAAGARLVGVNNRDLTTFATDLSVAEAVRPSLAGAEVTVAESGVASTEAAARMAAAGYDAILVGEAAVRAGDPAQFVAGLRGIAT